ncbi:MAG: N-formylglutamate amidohydrolase [Pseudomonadota bacterium]
MSQHAGQLLSRDDPAPFKVINGDGAGNALFVCDHASRDIPAALGTLGLPESERKRHIGWDIGAQKVTEILVERFDCPAVLGGYSRLVVDVNRQLWDPTGMPEISDQTVVPGNKNLSPSDRMARIREIFLPYHGAIEERIAYFHAHHRTPALIAIHSFTPIFQGFERPWEIGVLWDRDDRIPVPLLAALRAQNPGLTIGDNEPYSGQHLADYTIDHHGEAAGLPCVSIELRQDLIDTDEGCAKWAKILGDAFVDILADPGLYKLRRD